MDKDNELLDTLTGTKETLLDEARDLQQRAENLDWKELEKILIEKGWTEEEIAVEKMLFESMKRTSRRLAKYK